MFIGLAAQQADSVWILDRRYTRSHRDEDKRLAKLYVEKKEVLDYSGAAEPPVRRSEGH